MTKVAVEFQVPDKWERSTVTEIFRKIQDQLNLVSEGKMSARHLNFTTAPTSGTFALGDIAWDSAPAEAGAGGSKYVRLGWVCTTGGTPGTFKEMRVLTGN